MQRRFTCAATGIDCTAVRYHCTKCADVDLSPPAFAEGRFPAGTCARDFVRIDATDQPQVSLILLSEVFDHKIAGAPRPSKGNLPGRHVRAPICALRCHNTEPGQHTCIALQRSLPSRRCFIRILFVQSHKTMLTRA